MKRKWSFARFLDEWKLSFKGIKGVALRKEFWIPAIIVFLFFGTLLNLLSGGMAAMDLFPTMDFGGKMQIIGKGILKIFGVGQVSVLDWAFSFFISLLQGILIGLVVFVFKARKKSQEKSKSVSASAQNAGIIAGLAILGSGCPTCGTTLLMPIIVSIAGSSSMALASTISYALTIASIVIALFAMKKMGFEAYAILMDEKYREKKEQKKAPKKQGPARESC